MPSIKGRHQCVPGEICPIVSNQTVTNISIVNASVEDSTHRGLGIKLRIALGKDLMGVVVSNKSQGTDSDRELCGLRRTKDN